MKPPLPFSRSLCFLCSAFFLSMSSTLIFLCVCCRLSLPLSPPSVFLSLPPSGPDCAVKAVIVCLCVISCLNEGQVNEINFSCPYMGIALTHSRIVGLRMCLSMRMCVTLSPRNLHSHAPAGFRWMWSISTTCIQHKCFCQMRTVLVWCRPYHFI